MRRLALPLLSLALVATPLACKREAGTPVATAKSPAKAAATATAAKQENKGAVARIVFVDKDKCCACTRDRIDKSWKALTDVVGFPPVPDVERIHMDSQSSKAAPYQKLGAIMVPPAIYFLDKQGKLVRMLQGEVKPAQIKGVLSKS